MRQSRLQLSSRIECELRSCFVVGQGYKGQRKGRRQEIHYCGKVRHATDFARVEMIGERDANLSFRVQAGVQHFTYLPHRRAQHPRCHTGTHTLVTALRIPSVARGSTKPTYLHGVSKSEANVAAIAVRDVKLYQLLLPALNELLPEVGRKWTRVGDHAGRY